MSAIRGFLVFYFIEYGRTFLDFTSHNLAVPSSDADSMLLPSREKRTSKHLPL
jgi:hypothetical protein